MIPLTLVKMTTMWAFSANEVYLLSLSTWLLVDGRPGQRMLL
jgi:hypothetical protein